MTIARRKQLESQVAQAGAKVKLTTDNLDWALTTEFRELIDVWLDLVSYYIRQQDDMVDYISCEVIGLYLGYNRVINEILRDPRQVDKHENAIELLSSFDHIINSLIGAGYTKIHSDEDANKR